MKTFAQFITEATGIASAKHQEHPEDNAIKSYSGFEHAISSLKAIHHGLKTGNAGDTHISTKLDGAPAIVFGHHPEFPRFFVASKSAFNKNPKLNFVPYKDDSEGEFEDLDYDDPKWMDTMDYPRKKK